MNKSEEENQNYQAAIRNVVQHLKSKRSELENEIGSDELEKAYVKEEISRLEDKLSVIDANLRKKSEFRKEYDRAIYQSEKNFVDLLQKSEDFLTLTRREALALSHAVCDSPTLCNKAVKGPQNGNGISSSSDPSQSSSPPVAVLAVQPPGSQNDCINCSNTAPCTTIMIPYKANGL